MGTLTMKTTAVRVKGNLHLFCRRAVFTPLECSKMPAVVGNTSTVFADPGGNCGHPNCSVAPVSPFHFVIGPMY